MEITFNDVKNILIGILLVECHCVLFYIWVSECPKFQYITHVHFYKIM